MVQTPRVALTQITTIPGGGWTTHLKIVSQIGSFPKRCGLNKPPPPKMSLYNMSPEKGPIPKKKDPLPTIIFQRISEFSGG